MKIFNYKINGSPYRVVVQNADEGIVELEVNGTPYTVELEKKKKGTVSRIQRPVTAIQQSDAAAPRAAVKRSTAKAGQAVVECPLPGVIFDILVKEGDVVKKGQTIMILEAMKMENNIQSTADGTIKKISVEKGTTVLEGDELVVIG